MTEKLYTTNQLAAVFGVVPTTVIDWIERGKLEAFKTLGGHRRITHRAVLEFLERNRLRTPPALATAAPGILVQTADASLGEALREALRAEIPAAEVEFFPTVAAAMLRAGNWRPRLLVLDSPDEEARAGEAAAAVRAHFSQQPPAILLLLGGSGAQAADGATADYATVPRERSAAEIARACASLLQAPPS